MKKSVKNINSIKKSNVTELVFILDRSGSMSGLENDTIGGFNSMIKKQKSNKSDVFVSTVLFDDEAIILHDRLKLEDIKEMTEKEYYPRGTTALLDAIGSTIKHITDIHKYARKEDIPSKTLFVITTDGYENSSKTYNFNTVKEMIEKQKSENNWEFLFLGANIDAIGTAGKIGINADRAANIINDSKGVETMYKEVGDTLTCYCMCSDKAVLPKNWKELIDKDFARRK